MNDFIKVSVCCFTYNHAPYLREALDSVLMQKTSFQYEVIIGDDCSTDESQNIILEYYNKFSSIIRPIFQPVNSKGKKNFNDVYNSARGEYVITLETDDYWTDSSKLQKQVNFLDSNPNYIAVAHNCTIVDQNSSILDENYPSIKKGIFTFKAFGDGLLPGQTTTIMYRNPMFVQGIDMGLYYNPVGGPGDMRKIFCLMTQGLIFTLPDSMSAYRHIVSGGTSFSASHKRDDAFALKYYNEFQRYSRKFRNIEMQRAADVRLIQTALGAYRTNYLSISELFVYAKTCVSPFYAFFRALLNIIKLKIMK